MGTWGAALYDDDEASDLKTTIALVCKVPVDGDRLLEILEKVVGKYDPGDEDGPPFWLVIADQFERRGIACPRATANALAIIDSGSDLSAAKGKGADEKFLKKRAAVLQELAQRLRAPRPTRERKTPAKAPDMVLQTGEVYAFPSMNGRSWDPYRFSATDPFVPDGWGALVVLANGRAFDWLPWCALASLTVDGAAKPSLDEALRGSIMPHPLTRGAGRYIPKRADAKGMGLELLGSVTLNPKLVKPHLSALSVAEAVERDWTIAYAAFGRNSKGIPIGCTLASLLM